MNPNDLNFKITYGGWYQRTTLHLSEVYDLLARGSSNLKLSPEKLKEFQKLFEIKEISREAGYLEFIKARTESGIEIRYYEDGLYILEIESRDIHSADAILENYFENIFNPALSYIFSQGAPTPKVLANIKTAHPVVVSLQSEEPQNFEVPSAFGEVYSKIISHKIVVDKTPKFIFVVSSTDSKNVISELVEMQIFFREFKDQLEKYLNIHRTIWEEIADIKERKSIPGREVEEIRGRLDSYQKTISLISNRINQMGSYIRTRSSVAKGLNLEEELKTLFQFKFEVLADTLDYIKEIWKMTSDYLASAVFNIIEIKNQGTSRGIQSLQVITSVGVISGIIGYLARNELPSVTAIGVIYFAVIILATWLINYLIGKFYKNKKYNLKFSDTLKDI